MSQIDDYFNERLNRPDFKPESFYDAKAATKHLETITTILLKECGWEDDFCIAIDMNGKITLYLRIAYVAACSVEGNWNNIKEKIPELVEYAHIAKELRTHRDIKLYWIEKSMKDLNWENFKKLYR